MKVARGLAALAALAALIAAGCGQAPTPAKPVPPPAPKPVALAAGAKAQRVTRVGFSVHYPNGWTAHTTFGEDLGVSGRHRSGGAAPRLHLAEDKASPELWARLSELALEASALPMRELQPRPEKIYAITIDLSDGRSLRFETELGAGYKEPALQALAEVLHANERVYSNQQGQGWTLAVSKDPAARPTEIAWGLAVDVLQVGLKAARPAFAEGEPLVFTVHLRNVGSSAKGVSGIYFDDFFFRPVGGGVTLRSRWLGPQAAPPVKPPPPLEAGRGLEFPATVGGEDWHFEDASQPRAEAVGKPVHFPPAGKYAVTVGSTPGRVPSGEVEIEIKAKTSPVSAAIIDGKPFLNDHGDWACVMITNAMRDIRFDDDKAIRDRTAHLLDDEALQFWQKCCRDKGKPVDFTIGQSWSTPTKYKGMSIKSSLAVHIPAATCQRLLDASAAERRAIIDQPQAVTIQKQPGKL